MRGALSQRGQARLILTGLLDNVAQGVRETYLYQLLDAYPDPNAQDSEKHYGLFDINDRPKLSAQMLRRLMQPYLPAKTRRRHDPRPARDGANARDREGERRDPDRGVGRDAGLGCDERGRSGGAESRRGAEDVGESRIGERHRSGGRAGHSSRQGEAHSFKPWEVAPVREVVGRSII
jgi:hypothetical protein